MSPERAGRLADATLVLLAFALSLSIAVSEILLGAAIVLWLLSRPWRRPWPRGLVVLAGLTGALAGAWLLASATASDPLASLVKARKLYSIVLVFLVADRAREHAVLVRLAIAALAGGAVASAFGVVSFIAIRAAGTIYGHRMHAFFSTAMTSGNVFAMQGIAALAAAVSGAGRRVRTAGLMAAVLFAIALATTLTRSSWLGFLAGAAVVLAVRRPRALLVLALVVVLAFAFGPAEIRQRGRSIADPTWVTNQGRVSLWKSGLAVLADHPWTGVGLADHTGVILRYRRADATFPAGHFHNNPVQIAASTGIVGLLAWLAWMGGVLVLLLAGRNGPRRAWAWTGVAIWMAFQVSGFFDWSFGDAEVANQFFLWSGLGLAALTGPENTGNPGNPGVSGASPVRPLSGSAGTA